MGRRLDFVHSDLVFLAVGESSIFLECWGPESSEEPSESSSEAGDVH